MSSYKQIERDAYERFEKNAAILSEIYIYVFFKTLA